MFSSFTLFQGARMSSEDATSNSSQREEAEVFLNIACCYVTLF